jgi:5-hydroxyisourate hydrolase
MPGNLTTAVIDALRGMPAKGMLVDLFRLPRQAGERRHLRTIETNANGTVDAPLLAGDDLVPATYELLYHIGRYFKAQRVALEEAPFLDVVPVRFTLVDPNRTCHVALVVTPLSYTMYRA